jgi:hypothetical protein
MVENWNSANHDLCYVHVDQRRLEEVEGQHRHLLVLAVGTGWGHLP